MASNQLVELVEVEDFSEILPRSLFLFLKNNSNIEYEKEVYNRQLKVRWGYSEEEVMGQIFDLKAKEKEKIVENKEGWRKLKKHMGGI